MRVVVVLYGMLRDHLPEGAEGNRVDVDVAEGSTVADVAGALNLPGSALFSILVDGGRAAASDRVGDGSEVTLMPPFTGGR